MLDCPTHGSGQHRCFALYAITALAKLDPPQVLSYIEGLVESSHLCHQAGCAAESHIIIEGRNRNHQRTSCQKFAMRLRQTGQKVPETCTIHRSPCLLREASLTREEMVASAFLSSHNLGTTNLKATLEKAGLLGEVEGEFAAHPYSYFYLGGDFPPDFGCPDHTATMPF
ncbi:hypothetical protein V495_07490 [Pseudogymnoascus sp. VKM F-4514 (FW-929)]|nr:hypothetical protein V495_07490 [Pseudogymnoascus sp. VKM F-4514 (FW-929)]KFY65253.1 hypothetical protein V497_01453 [Pseudogymnoascus sp. VKM F-4516 (FW-969)]